MPLTAPPRHPAFGQQHQRRPKPTLKPSPRETGASEAAPLGRYARITRTSSTHSPTLFTVTFIEDLNVRASLNRDDSQRLYETLAHLDTFKRAFELTFRVSIHMSTSYRGNLSFIIYVSQ